MSKIKYSFQLPKKEDVEHNGMKIKVVPFLTTDQQVFLIQQYLSDYFSMLPKEDRLVPALQYNNVMAEYNLMSNVYQLVTNIDPESMTNDMFSDTELWEKISNTIKNYFYFENLLYDSVETMIIQVELENSLGNVISKTMEKLNDVLEKFSEMTPEEVKKLQKEGVNLLKELEENSIIKDMSRKGN